MRTVQHDECDDPREKIRQTPGHYVAPAYHDRKGIRRDGILIEDYDDRRYPLKPNDPVTVLTELMEVRGLTQKDLWTLFGSKGTASEVLNRKRSISKTQARKLVEFFHVPADLFI